MRKQIAVKDLSKTYRVKLWWFKSIKPGRFGIAEWEEVKNGR